MKRRFVYKGFIPDDQLKVLAQKSLDRIFSTSPSDAKPVAFIEKTSEGFNGQVKITSAHGLFEAEVKANEANQVVDQLSQEIKLQLDAWKKIRFL